MQRSVPDPTRRCAAERSWSGLAQRVYRRQRAKQAIQHYLPYFVYNLEAYFLAKKV